MKTFDAVEILNRKFGNTPDIREKIAEESINLQFSELIYQVRTDAGLTQKQLAELIGTKQPVIARLEDADYDGHSLKMLQKIAVALNKKLSINFVEAEVSVVCSANYLGRLLYRKFDQWLESGWQTLQSLGLELKLPQFEYAAARSLPNAEPNLLEAEILVAEKLANSDPNHPLASVRMAKTLYDLGHPAALVISVSQVSDVEPVNVLLRLHSLNDENLPVGICMKLLDEQGQPEYFIDDPDEMIEDRSNGQTKTIYLSFKYPKGECFSIETTQGEIKICEQFFV